MAKPDLLFSLCTLGGIKHLSQNSLPRNSEFRIPHSEFTSFRSCRSGTYFGSFERQSKQSALFADIRRCFIEKCSPPSTADSAAQKFVPLPNAKASASLNPQMPDAAARFFFSTKRSPPASAVSAAGKVVREIKCSRVMSQPFIKLQKA